jgi:hypothetical protein
MAQALCELSQGDRHPGCTARAGRSSSLELRREHWDPGPVLQGGRPGRESHQEVVTNVVDALVRLMC